MTHTQTFNVGKAPCGTQVAETPQTNFTMGQSFTAQYRIDANHGGYVQMNLITNGRTISLADKVNVQGTGTGTKDQLIQLPFGVTCNPCIFQWIWVPNKDVETSNYYACSDIKIVNGAMGSIKANWFIASMVASLLMLVFML